MSNPGVYADLVKAPSDLIKKEYPSTKQIEITEKVPGIDNATVTGTVVLKENGSVLATLNPKYTIKELKNAKLSISGDTTKFGKGELTFESLAPGLKAVFNGDSNKLISADFQYKKDNFALTALLKSNKKLTGSATFGFGKFSVGLQTIFDANNNKVDDYEATAVFKNSQWLVAVAPKSKASKLNVVALDRVTDRLALAADLTVDLKAPEKSPSFTLGSQYFIDSKSFIKTKINCEGRVGLGYTFPVNNFTKATVALDINGKDLTAEGKHGFGFNIVLNL